MEKPVAIARSWCLTGAAVITLLGFVWHYLYDWSGQNRILGAIVPVNESVWEHLKLGYWPLVLFSVAEYAFIKGRVTNYFFGKLAGIVALEALILLIHYTYTSLAARLHTGIDITSFVLGVALCQYTAFRIYTNKPHKKRREVLSLAGFLALGAVFILTTYYPPHYKIFRDQNTNTTGIHKTTAQQVK